MWTVPNICPCPEQNSNQGNFRLISTIVIHFESLIQRNGRPFLDSLYCFSTNLPLLTHLKNMKGLEQTLQSKDWPHLPLQSLLRVPGLPSPCFTKRQHSWAAHMGSWFLASSAPLGLAVFFTTPWKLTSGVLHSLSSICWSEPGWWRLTSLFCSPQGTLTTHQSRVLSF